MRKLTLPGLVDVHVHLRYPGGEHKETIETGTAAALAGGVVAVLGMPNTSPPLIAPPNLRTALEYVGTQARCDVGLYYGATQSNAEAIAAAADLAAGLKIYLDETYGPLRLETLQAVQSHFRAWPAGKPLVVHAEGMMTAAAISLAAAWRKPVHIAHVSRQSEIELIRAAKERGLPVTCEVAPHHLWLTSADASAMGGYGEVRPPLASEADRAALWRNLDAIDVIATDHAPHTRDEKESVSPPPGFPGLETTLPLLLTAVHEDRLTLDRLVELTSTRPAELFSVPTPEVAEVDVALGDVYTLPSDGWQTRAGWSPFAGLQVSGRVLETRLRGRKVYDGETVLAGPGSGHLLPAGLYATTSRRTKEKE